MTEFAFSFAGFAVGLIVGLTGVGGGSLMTPILIFFFGIQPHLAIGTDLLFAAGTKLGGSVQLARKKRIDWNAVGLLALGSVPASLVTLYVLHSRGAANPEVQRLMTSTLGVALLLTAAATFYKAVMGSKQGQIPQNKNKKDSTESISGATTHLKPSEPTHIAWPILLGAAVGVLVTLTSVGAGAIGVLVLMVVYPYLPLPRIVAADIAHAVPLTLIAGLGHAGMGSVDWSLLAWLLAGSIPGILLGSRLTSKLPERFLRGLLSLLLIYAGTKLIAL